MTKEKLEGVGGWLLVYLICSIPPLVFYSMGLSGWFFDYPFVLMAAIFLALAAPLLLVLMRSRKAPKWNIAVLWIAAVLMALRAISVFLFPMAAEGQPPLSSEEVPRVVAILSLIVGFAFAWAVVWTKYFKESVRVRNTFS